MISCSTCQTWSHVKCDLLLLDPVIKEQMMATDSFFQYSCQACRKQGRLKFIYKIISELEAEDKNGYYADEFWLESDQFNAVQAKQYLRQIKNPVCFTVIKRRIDTYLLSPEKLKIDILQIFLNAKNYNRQNTQIYKDADKMYAICLDKLTGFMPYLDK